MTSDNFKRVGVAFTAPRGPNNHRDEYSILELAEAYGRKLGPPARYVRYVGYREHGPTGEVMVGLPLGGRGWRPQPLMSFIADHYTEVRIFNR